jgi:hypothetical protein
MKNFYDRYSTRYYCDRCGTPIEIESDSFYEFVGIEDSNFWCPSCEDLPKAEIFGTPARDLPKELYLPKGFVCRVVPLAEPDDVKNWSIIYRPFSIRSFLRQYIDWLIRQQVSNICDFSSHFTAGASFDPDSQMYTTQLDYLISDVCDSRPCAFMQTNAIKPIDPNCQIMTMLCKTKGPYGLCETGDEAMILKRYLSINGGQHYPMLIPQPTLLKGKKRPDFLCFVPLSKFQYQKVIILVDRPGKKPEDIREETRLYEQLGYMVRRIEIELASRSYFIEARRLSNWIESIPRGAHRPPLASFRKTVENPTSWAKVLSEDPEFCREIEQGVFEDGTMGKFL